MKLARQQGLSLLELAISISLAGMIVVVGLIQAMDAIQEQRLHRESEWIIDTLSDIQLRYKSSSSFGSLSDFTLGSIKSIPPEFLSVDIGATTVSNSFGGRIHVAPLSIGSLNNAYALTYARVPAELCAKLLAQLENTANKKSVYIYAIAGHRQPTSTVPIGSIIFHDDQLNPIDDADQVVLKASPKKGLNLSKVADYCASDKETAIRSISLIRRPS